MTEAAVYIRKDLKERQHGLISLAKAAVRGVSLQETNGYTDLQPNDSELVILAEAMI